jgi:hypothetical protein
MQYLASIDWAGWLQTALTLVGTASAVAAVTPTPRDDDLVGRLYKVLEALALNIGHAKDAPPNRPTR